MKESTYIAFLRAVNVGGRVVKMERLRELFSELGLGNVRTYIQTGNVFFTSDTKDRAKLTADIEAHLEKALGFEVPTMLRTVAEVEHALRLEPFKDVEMTDEVRLCVAFISRPLPPEAELPFVSAKGDIDIRSATAGEVFIVAYHSPGKAANAAAFLEKTYKVKATVRFWGTTAKIWRRRKQSRRKMKQNYDALFEAIVGTGILDFSYDKAVGQLFGLVDSMKADGMSQVEIYTLFADKFVWVRDFGRSNELHYDAMADMMDEIWVLGHSDLFTEPLTDEKVNAFMARRESDAAGDEADGERS